MAFGFSTGSAQEDKWLESLAGCSVNARDAYRPNQVYTFFACFNIAFTCKKT